METLQKHRVKPLHPELAPNLYLRVFEKSVCLRIKPCKYLFHHCVDAPNVLLLRHDASEEELIGDDQVAEQLESSIGREQSEQEGHYMAHARDVVDIGAVQLIILR